MPETSYNPTYTPFAQWSVRQAPVPATAHNLPGSISGSGSIQSSLIATTGFSQISVGINLSQNGTISVQRYLDTGGTVVQGAPVAMALVAGVTANLDVQDGKPFAAFKITVTNSTGSAATVNSFALLLQASDIDGNNNASDGSGTITTGGTAQTLFGGIAPDNGFAIYNPDPSNDLWVSDSATAATNGTGSIRVAANGGAYETPANYRPIGSISIIGASTGQKFTARRW